MVVACGPGINLVLAVLAFGLVAAWSHAIVPAASFGIIAIYFALLFGGANLFFVLSQLVPLRDSDGAKLLDYWCGGGHAQERWMLITGTSAEFDRRHASESAQ